MKFLLLYSGPPPSPETSHAEWPDWFNRIGDAVNDHPILRDARYTVEIFEAPKVRAAR